MATPILIEDKFTCTPEALFALLSDDAFDSILMHALDMAKESLDQKKTDAGSEYKIRLTNPEDVPAIAKKFIGDKLSYIEVRRWNNKGLSNEWTIEPETKGVTVLAKGTTKILATDGGCVRKTEGSISVSIPLIGKKIEEMVLKGIVDTFRKNTEFCTKHIAENGI